MKVKVGLFDILFGVQLNPYACMTARAINRALPGHQACVCVGEITVLGGPEPLKAPVPYALAEKIVAFDRSKWSVRPFEIELHLVEVPMQLPTPAEMLEPAGCAV